MAGLSNVRRQTLGTIKLEGLEQSVSEDEEMIHVRPVGVASRRAPKHYGVIAFESYKPAIHHEGEDRK